MTLQDPPPRGTLTAVQFFLFVVLSAFLFIIPWFYGLTGFKEQLIAELVIFSTFLIFFSFLNFRAAFPGGFFALDRFVLYVTGLIFLHGLVSVMPLESLVSFRRSLGFVLFYFLLRGLVSNRQQLRRFLWVMSLIAALYSIYGLFQYYGFFPSAFWYRYNSLASRFVNGSHFAVFLFFGIFSALSAALSSRNWFLRLLLAVLLLIMGYALVLSRARTAWISLAIAGCFFIGCLKFFRLMKGRTFWMLVLVAFMAVISGGFFGRALLSIIWQRFGELWAVPGAPKFYNLLYRFDLWQGCLQAIAARPMGWGLGTFQHIFPKYRVHIDRFFVDYAHNDFLQLTADLGLAGLAAILLLIGMYFRKAFLLMRTPRVSADDKITAIGFASTGLSLILASLTDFALRIYAIGFFFAAFLALSAYLFETADPKEEKTGSAMPVMRITIFILVFAMNFLTAKHLFAQIHFEKAVRLEKDFKWNQAEQEYLKAESLIGYDIKYLNALGLLYQKRSGLSFRGGNKIRYRSAAIRILERLVKLQPLNPDNHYRLAFLYEEEKKLDQARQEFLTALDIEPRNALFLSEFGHFAIRQGMKDDAVQSFEKYLKVPEKVEGAEVDAADLLKRIYQVTQDYKELKRVLHDDWYSHGCLGRLLGENGRWEIATVELDLSLTHASEILKAEPGYLDAVIRKPIADFYIAHGRHQDAVRIYKRALEVNPKDASAQDSYDIIRRQMTASHSGA